MTTAYKINECQEMGILHGRAEILNFSSSIFHKCVQRTSEIFFNMRREISYLQVVM